LPIIMDEKILRQIEDDTYPNGKSKANGRPAHLKVTKPGERSKVATPLFRAFEDKQVANHARFARPRTYITYEDKAPNEYDGVEYELDSNDEQLLAALNRQIKVRAKAKAIKAKAKTKVVPRSIQTRASIRARARAKAAKSRPKAKRKRDSVAPSPISDEQLEQIIDSLEKEAFFKLGLRQLRDNTSFFCSVCNESASDRTNILLVCDGCNIAVHQQCYGVVDAPHGPWLCRRCESRETSLQCILCGGRSGAFKRTTVDGQWAHLLCALWMPGVSFRDDEFLEPIEGINYIPADRWNKCCSLCIETMGVCVLCDEKGCGTMFHIGCARSHGCFVEARPSPSNATSLVSYCKQHSLQRLDHYQRYPRECRQEMADTQRLVHGMGIAMEDFDLIYSYWRIKRRVHPTPLLPRLQVLCEEGYIPAQTTLGDAEYRSRFIKLRQDFERARVLIDLVRKRELLKRKYLETLQCIVDNAVALTQQQQEQQPQHHIVRKRTKR
jgi:hypothetical protein